MISDYPSNLQRTAAQWASIDPFVPRNQLAVESDTGRQKVGVGLRWSATAYLAAVDASDVVKEAPSDGGTYARENGEWVDVSEAANLQLRRGTEAERVQITPLEGEPIYTTDSKKLYIGDGSTAGGNEIVSGEKAPQQNPPGMVRMVSVMSASAAQLYRVTTTTGYAAARWWDGSVQVYGSGNPATLIDVTISNPTTGNWSKSAPKEIFIWSCTSGDATQSGDLTTLNAQGRDLTSIDVRGLSALTELRLNSNDITSLDLSGLSSLEVLSANLNPLEGEFDFSGLSSLRQIILGTTSITSVKGLNDAAGLEYIGLTGCLISSLDLRGFPSLNYVNVGGNPLLTKLDVTGATFIDTLSAVSSGLESIRATGVVIGGYQHPTVPFIYSYGANLQGNSLSDAALDQFYTDLATTSSFGSINVLGNPGASSDNPAIATAKGYTIYGS